MSEDEAAHEDRVTYRKEYKGHIIEVTASRRPGPGYRMDGIVIEHRDLEGETLNKNFGAEGNKETGYVTKEVAVREGFIYGRWMIDEKLG